MSRRPRATIHELRAAVQCLPRATRIAMLEGLEAGPIIAGAYASGDGICPMLAAHRAGGRCNAAFFADAWDQFALRDGRGRRGAARRVNERELRILRVHLEASLLDEELADATLAGALYEHRQLLARRQSTVEPEPEPEPEPKPEPEPEPEPEPAWSRLVRRYDEYEAALVHLHAAADAGAPSGERADHVETVSV
jgi:hypothetical protein